MTLNPSCITKNLFKGSVRMTSIEEKNWSYRQCSIHTSSGSASSRSKFISSVGTSYYTGTSQHSRQQVTAVSWSYLGHFHPANICDEISWRSMGGPVNEYWLLPIHILAPDPNAKKYRSNCLQSAGTYLNNTKIWESYPYHQYHPSAIYRV
jgi:hypothetical protein